MPTLADIPPDFLVPDQRDEFAAWVKNQLVDKWTKKDMLYLWANELGQRWTYDEIQEICGDV